MGILLDIPQHLCDNDIHAHFYHIQSQPTYEQMFLPYNVAPWNIIAMGGDSIWHSHSKFTFFFILTGKCTYNFFFQVISLHSMNFFHVFPSRISQMASFCAFIHFSPSHLLIYHRLTSNDEIWLRICAWVDNRNHFG